MSEIKDGKNIVNARIDAGGNVIVGDGNYIINLKEAAQYKTLEADIEKLNIRFERTQKRLQKDPVDSDAQEELLEIDAERSEKRNNLETLKTEVIKLADDFQRIPLNTERLRKAKAHFDAGEFDKARAVFDAEVETMGKELDALLDEKGRLQHKTLENQQNLSDKANEYLILARLTATNFELPDHFDKAMEYFEQALRAEKNQETLFAYAYFLQEHNQYKQAAPLYEEALHIYRALAKENPAAYLPYVATTLNNLAVLQKAKNEFAAALEKYEEALHIYRALAKENPAAYLPYVATTLNNLAVLQKAKNEFAAALEKYEEALHIYRALAKENPAAYLPDVAMTVINLSIFYLQSLPNKEKSIALALEAVKILLPVYKQIPYLENYLKTALKVLQENGMDVENLMNGA